MTLSESKRSDKTRRRSRQQNRSPMSKEAQSRSARTIPTGDETRVAFTSGVLAQAAVEEVEWYGDRPTLTVALSPEQARALGVRFVQVSRDDGRELRKAGYGELLDAAPKPAPAGAFPELRGEQDSDGETVAGFDARYGVPCPIGTLVDMMNIGKCIVIDGTRDFAILLDRNGQQWAERWGALLLQCSGPAFGATVPAHDPDAEREPGRSSSASYWANQRTDDPKEQSNPSSDPTLAARIEAMKEAVRERVREQYARNDAAGLLALDAMTAKQLRDDPYAEAALRIRDLEAFIDRVAGQGDSLEADTVELHRMLTSLYAKITEASAHRSRSLTDIAIEDAANAAKGGQR